MLFAYRLFHDDFSPIYPHGLGRRSEPLHNLLSIVSYMYMFVLFPEEYYQ